MDRVHRIFVNHNRPFKAFLDQKGIAHEYDSEPFIGELVRMEIAESDPSWPELEAWLEQHDVEAFHTVELRYTPEEQRSASRSWFGTLTSWGRPMPEERYEEVTYQPGSVCSCRIGRVQVAPFRVRRAPNPNPLKILGFLEVADEFFISSLCRAQIEAAGLTGMNFEPLVLHSTGEAIPGWFQVKVTELLPPSLNSASLTSETCGDCDRVKFNYPRGGQVTFTLPLSTELPDIVKSHEWFGSGGAAFRLILVSQRFVDLMGSQGWRNTHLEPVVINPLDLTGWGGF